MAPFFLILFSAVLAQPAFGVGGVDRLSACAVALSKMARLNRKLLDQGRLVPNLPDGRNASGYPSFRYKSPVSGRPIQVPVKNGAVFGGDSIVIHSPSGNVFGQVVATLRDSSGTARVVYLDLSGGSEPKFRLLADNTQASRVTDSTKADFNQAVEMSGVDWGTFGSIHRREHRVGNPYVLPAISRLTMGEQAVSVGDWISYPLLSSGRPSVRKVAKIQQLRGDPERINEGGVLVCVAELNSQGETIDTILSAAEVPQILKITDSHAAIPIPEQIGLRITSGDSFIAWGGREVGSGDQVTLADPESLRFSGNRVSGRLGEVKLTASLMVAHSRTSEVRRGLRKSGEDGMPVPVHLGAREPFNLLEAEHTTVYPSDLLLLRLGELDPHEQARFERRSQELLAKDDGFTFPVTRLHETRAREPDKEFQGRKYVSEHHGLNPHSPQQFGGAGLEFLIARFPDYMQKLGFELRDDAIAYPDVDGLNLRLDLLGRGKDGSDGRGGGWIDNGLRFLPSYEDARGDAAVWEFVDALADGKICVAQRDAAHFETMKRVPIYPLLPKKIVELSIAVAKFFKQLAAELPQTRADLYLPASALNDLVNVRWAFSMEDALSLRLKPAALDIVNDSSLYVIGQQYSLGELTKAFGLPPNRQVEFEYPMGQLPLNPRKIAEFVKRRIEGDLTLDENLKLQAIVSAVPEMAAEPLTDSDLTHILGVR